MFNDIKSIILNTIPNCDSELITPQSSLSNTLRITSMDFIGLIIQLEDHFNIHFDNDAQIETIQDLMDYISSKQQ